MIKKVHILNLFFFLLVLGLWIPSIQQITLFKYEKPLMGDISEPKTHKLSKASWLNENFQEGILNYVNQKFGFRTYMVRLHNQLHFWLFNKAFAKGVIVGKNNYLFEEKYIDSYFGNDYREEEDMDKMISRITTISNELSKLKIHLILLIAPGKGYFYSEYIPNKYIKERSKTNYEYITNKLNTTNIHFIDFNKFFIEEKTNSLYNLYPKTGVHWSTYGMIKSADSLLNYMEKISKINMPKMVIDFVEISTKTRYYDQDIEDGMNLLFSINKPSLAYPHYRFTNNDNRKPSVLTIGDSFWWGIYYSGIPEKVFGSHEFWYYNEQSFNINNEAIVNVSDIDLKEKIFENNFIILQSSEGLLQSFPWGFVDKAYAILKDVNIPNRATQYEQQIYNDPKWLELIKNKAIENGLSLEEQVKIDALYMAENE